MNESIRSWVGYQRPDGRKGIRNVILVLYTVECAKHIAHEMARDADDVHVIGFPGCYDNAYAVRLMLALARHPNVGAALVVGLGCEYTQPEKLCAKILESGRPAEWFYIQQHGGTSRSIAHGKGILNGLRVAISQSPRTTMSVSDLIVGCECGGSDWTSGLVGNPVVGAFLDQLVDLGGCAIFEEIVEMIGLDRIIAERAVDSEARAELTQAYRKAVAYCKSVRQYSISPGNFVGGLTTIEEKSLGAFAKSGHRPIQGVLKVAEAPRRSGRG